MKVVHVVESLDRGAVENWLLRMFRHARDRGINLNWTFYCILERQGALDEAAQAQRIRVVHSPAPLTSKVEFVRGLRAEVRNGAYDVVHCHHDLLSAVYLLSSLGAPIQRRIVHVHNADESVATASRLKRLLYRESMRQVCLSMADRIVGISNHTLDTFLAGRPRH